MTIAIVSRTSLLSMLLAALLIAAASSEPLARSPVAPSAALADDDDESGDDDDDDDGEEGEDDDDGGEEGDEDDSDDDGGDDDDDGSRSSVITEEPVSESDSLGVEVHCEREGHTDRSICEFIPFGGTAPVLDLLIPAASVCAAVSGGDFETVLPVPAQADEVDFYSARPGITGVILIFAESVQTSGTTTYWVENQTGRQPAPGPGLSCPESATPPASTVATGSADSQTGSILVQAYSCDTPKPADAGAFDWYGECTAPAPNLTLDLFLGEGDGPVKSIRSDKNGQATFLDLNPGTYRLEQADTNWCHAESDSVTASGEVETVAGEQALVWVFQCAEGT